MSSACTDAPSAVRILSDECPSNADAFLKPFGPPVLQVASDEWALLSEHAERRSEIQLLAVASRTPVTRERSGHGQSW